MAVTAAKKPGTSISLKPLGDRIVVQRDESEQATAGGILLPETAKDKPSRGVVIAVGDGRMLKNGQRVPLQVKPGDHVLFTTYGPDEIKIDGEEYLLMREEDVLAVIE